MKTLKSVAVLFLVLNLSVATAQYGYGNGGMYGGGMNRMGSQNQQSIQNTNNFGRGAKTPEQIEKERVDNLNKTIDMLTKDLNLDDLQVIVIRKEIESSSKNITTVMKSESQQEDKIKEIEAINEKTDRTINTYLNDEQKKKYKKFIDDKKERIEKLKNQQR